MKTNNFCRSILVLLLVCLGAPGAFSDTEPNSSFETASDLAAGVSTSGSVNGSSDPADWYRVEVPEAGELTVTVTHDPSDFQFILYGRDDDFEIIGTETNAPSGRRLLRSVEAGTYHIQVNSRNNFTPVPYTILVELDEAPAVTGDGEPNDSPDTPSTASLNVEEVGHISHTREDRSIDNLDYYRIDLPEDAEVSFTFSHDPPDHSFQFRVLRSDGVTDIFGTETNFPSGDTRTRSLAAGTYFMEVNGRGETRGRTYRFTVAAVSRPPVTADSEPNDTPRNAAPLPLDTEHIGHISHTRDTGDVDNLDYYRFDLSGEQEVGFTFSHDPPEHPFQFRVLKEDGATSVFGTETNFPSGDTRTRTLDPGAYFLEVNGRGSTQGRAYTFTVDTPGGENSAPTAVIDLQTLVSEAPFQVRFDASGSRDTDGTITGYLWEITDGRTSSEQVFDLTFDSAGTYGAKLTVEDDDGLTHTAEVTFLLKEEGTETGNEATLSMDLRLFIPRLRYDSGIGIPITASITMTIEITSPTAVFLVTDVVFLDDTGPVENEATLSADLNLHIPLIRYDSVLGELLLSATFRAVSTTDRVLFEVAGVEIVSN